MPHTAGLEDSSWIGPTGPCPCAFGPDLYVFLHFWCHKQPFSHPRIHDPLASLPPRTPTSRVTQAPPRPENGVTCLNGGLSFSWRGVCLGHRGSDRGSHQREGQRVTCQQQTRIWTPALPPPSGPGLLSPHPFLSLLLLLLRNTSPCHSISRVPF